MCRNGGGGVFVPPLLWNGGKTVSIHVVSKKQNRAPLQDPRKARAYTARNTIFAHFSLVSLNPRTRSQPDAERIRQGKGRFMPPPDDGARTKPFDPEFQFPGSHTKAETKKKLLTEYPPKRMVIIYPLPLDQNQAPTSFKTPPSPHRLFDLQDSLDKRMHFLSQLSDFVSLRNGFYSFSAQTE